MARNIVVEYTNKIGILSVEYNKCCQEITLIIKECLNFVPNNINVFFHEGKFILIKINEFFVPFELVIDKFYLKGKLSIEDIKSLPNLKR